jgi:hypothetical protein
VHMTSADCWANPSHRTHDRSMMHIDRAGSNRKRLALRQPASTISRGVLRPKPGPVESTFQAQIRYLLGVRLAGEVHGQKDSDIYASTFDVGQ